MSASTSRLVERKQDFVRTEIWNAALDLFIQNGYEATTVEEIARRAGISRRTFFRYYASKDDLMVKAVDVYGDLLAASIRDAPPVLPPLEILRRAVVHVAEFVVAQPRVRDTMHIATTSAAARGAQLAEMAVVEDRLAREFAKAIGPRGRRGHTPRLMASVTLAVLSVTFRAWFQQPPSRVGEQVEDILSTLTGLFVVPRTRKPK
jgi:AcrR family transcriptional regulator